MRFEDWGRIDYELAWNKQRSFVDQRIQSEIEDTIVFCEHNQVVTLGRGAQRDLSANPGSSVFTSESLNKPPVFEVERGGHATYHGPGQVVVYPIVKLLNGNSQDVFFNGVHGLIRSLEIIVSDYLKSEFNLNAGSVPGKTGIWIDSRRKIASIGISARKWVSYHGLSLNFDTGPDVWQLINPCGFESSVMTDLFKETGTKQSYSEISSGLKRQFEKYFSNTSVSERVL